MKTFKIKKNLKKAIALSSLVLALTPAAIQVSASCYAYAGSSSASSYAYAASGESGNNFKVSAGASITGTKYHSVYEAAASGSVSASVSSGDVGGFAISSSASASDGEGGYYKDDWIKQ